MKDLTKKHSPGHDGKIFEEQIAKSCPENILVKKLADNAASFSGGNVTHFTSSNECDFIMHDWETGIFYGLELKTTKGPSFTFWREDFEKEEKKRTYQIKKSQILGLLKWRITHPGVYGFILNFDRKEHHTYFVPIDIFYAYINKLDKTRINEADVKNMAVYEISAKKLRSRYLYDMKSFFKISEKWLFQKG